MPRKDRPNFLTSRLRGLALLRVLGVLAIISTVAAGFVGAGGHGVRAVVGRGRASPSRSTCCCS